MKSAINQQNATCAQQVYRYVYTYVSIGRDVNLLAL